MARKATKKSSNGKPDAEPGNGVQGLVKELWQAAVNLRGSIDYKRYVLPIIFLRFLWLWLVSLGGKTGRPPCCKNGQQAELLFRLRSIVKSKALAPSRNPP
jgi:HsdM N-terminal domain